MAILLGKSAKYPEWIRMPVCCEGYNNECAEMGIQLIWRDDNAWPCLPDFRTTSWIKGNQKDIAP